jgi:hypothetical protein
MKLNGEKLKICYILERVCPDAVDRPMGQSIQFLAQALSLKGG